MVQNFVYTYTNIINQKQWKNTGKKTFVHLLCVYECVIFRREKNDAVSIAIAPKGSVFSVVFRINNNNSNGGVHTLHIETNTQPFVFLFFRHVHVNWTTTNIPMCSVYRCSSHLNLNIPSRIRTNVKLVWCTNELLAREQRAATKIKFTTTEKRREKKKKLLIVGRQRTFAYVLSAMMFILFALSVPLYNPRLVSATHYCWMLEKH